MRGNKLNRRNFLWSSAAATLAVSPLMNLLSATRVHAAPPRRVLFVYFPDGCIPSRFHPTPTTGGGYTLNAMTQPLAPVQQHLVFLDGLSMYGGGGTHEGGIRKVLTGTAPVSLDVFLGQKFAGQTPHNSLQLGCAANFQNGSGGMSFIGTEREVKPDDDPLNAFSRVFGNVDTGGGDGGAADLVARQKKSVLDASLSDLARLSQKFGSAEREKLETHVESVREVERRITTTVVGGAAACTTAGFNAGGYHSSSDSYPKTYEKEENFQTVGRLQMDLAVLALSCNATRVASVMLSHPVSPTHLTKQTNISVGHHDASHFGDPNGATGNTFVALQAYFMGEIAYLVDKLAKTPEGDGSMMIDNTLVMVCSELGDSNLHDHDRVPFVLAGGAGGALKKNRLLKFNGEAHSKLLVSIAHMMGVTDIDSYGYIGHGRGPLPGL